MFDPSKFDALIKKAQEFDGVMGRYMNATGLPMIDSVLKTLADSSKEAVKLLRVLDDIKGDFKAMALEQAKMTAAELHQITKFQQRRDLMDKILMNIKTQNKELAKQASDSKKLEQSIKARLQLDQQSVATQIATYQTVKKTYEQQIKMARTIEDRLAAEEAVFQIEDKILAAQKKDNDLQEKANKLIDKQVEKQKKLKEQYMANKDAAAEIPGMKTANNEAEAREQRARRMKFLKENGGNIIQPLMDEMGLGKLAGLFGGLAAAVLTVTGLIGTGLVAVIRETMASAHALTNQGVNLGQAGAYSVAPAGMLKSVYNRDHLQASPTDINEIRGTLANSLGTLNYGNQEELIANAHKLNQMYGISVEQSAEIFSNVSRWNNNQAGAADSAYKLVTALAGKNGMPIGTVFKDMADHTEIFAKYAGRGADAFAKALIAARQYGTTIESASGFADRLVDDFEGSLKMQAQIQTFMPGADFSGVTYAAQFGTDDQVMDEISKMLKSTGMKSIDDLPRSMRNMLLSSTGLSAQDVQGYLSGKPKGTALETPTETEANTILKDIDKWVQQLAQQGLSILVNPGKMWGFFLRHLGEEANGVNQPESTAKVGKNHAGGMAGDWSGTSIVPTHAYSSAPRYHTGFMPDEVPAILQRGEAVLSRTQLHGLTNLVSVSHTLGMLGNVLNTTSSNSSVNNQALNHVASIGGANISKIGNVMNELSTQSTVSSPTMTLNSDAANLNGSTSRTVSVGSPSAPTAPSKVESLLKDLISAVKSKQDIYMDGKKVGSTITQSYSRS